jgi:hypothetical protein
MAHRTLAAMDWASLTGLAPRVLAGYSDVLEPVLIPAARPGA